MVLPGPEAPQLATYIGWLMQRRAAASSPARCSCCRRSSSSSRCRGSTCVRQRAAVAGVLYGIKPAVTAIVLFAAYRIGSRALKHPLLWAVAAAAFLAIFAFDVPFPAIVLAAGSLGRHLGGSHAPDKFAAGGGHARPAKLMARRSSTTTRRRPSMHFPWARLARRVGRSLLWAARWRLAALWRWTARSRRWAGSSPRRRCSHSAAPTRCCRMFSGRRETLRVDDAAANDRRPRARRNHTRAADHGGRLRRLRRRLEPGITYSAPTESAFTPGRRCACVATFFTFLPSFLFILLGAPLVEATHDDLKLHGAADRHHRGGGRRDSQPAAFFAYHVLVARRFRRRLRRAIIPFCPRRSALLRPWPCSVFKIGVIPVIARVCRVRPRVDGAACGGRSAGNECSKS